MRWPSEAASAVCLAWLKFPKIANFLKLKPCNIGLYSLTYNSPFFKNSLTPVSKREDELIFL
jgi:hypothetical protein